MLLVVGTGDPEHFDDTVSSAVGTIGLSVESLADGLRTISPPGAPLRLLYRHHEGFVIFGFTDDALADAVDRAEEGSGFGRSDAYRHVVDTLGPDPDGIAYLNLPRLHALLEGSSVLQRAVAMEPRGSSVYRAFVPEEPWRTGVAWATYRVDGGWVHKSLVPEGEGVLDYFLAGGGGGGLAMAGIVSAVAVPNLLHAVDRGKQKRTMADIRSISAACEAYSVGHEQYPATAGKGFVGLESVAGHLQASSVRTLPLTDGWGHPLLYWSDGRSYTILSPGKDGRKEWSLENWTAGTTTDVNADIVLQDGVFVRFPAEVQG